MTMLVTPARASTELAIYVGALGVRSGDLADAVQISHGYMSSIIQGHRRPSRRLRRSIAEALDVPETTLFPEETP